MTAVTRPAASTVGLGSAAAVFAIVGAAVGLWAGDRIYGSETQALQDAATAQDLVTLIVVAPMTLLLGRAAWQGRAAACRCWLGCQAFLLYNGAIYAFSVHFGPLFLVWVATLGLSTFALIGGLSGDRLREDRPLGAPGVRGPAWLLIGLAMLFALLWLGEIAPDLIAGRPSRSASEWNVPTNPVHVLDLAFFLPAAATSGILLLRRHPLGYATAAGQLVWLGLTCLPILLTPVVQDVRGHEPGWGVLGPITVLFAGCAVALRTFLRGMHRTVER